MLPLPYVQEQVEGHAASDWQRIAESRAAKIEELDTRLKQTYLEIKQLSAEVSRFGSLRRRR
jgi:hypothetical protein